MKYWLLVFIFSILSTGLFAQDETQKGIQLGTLLSFDQLALRDQIINGEQRYFRSDDLYPEFYQQGYQIGLIRKRDKNSVSHINLRYFPEFTRKYTETRYGGTGWGSTLWEDSLKSVSMTLYLLDLNEVFRINISMDRLYLCVGAGASAGILQWNTDVPDGEFKTFIGQVYPMAGFELVLMKHLSIFAMYHYHYGFTRAEKRTVDNLDHEYRFDIQGRELKGGINVYF